MGAALSIYDANRRRQEKKMAAFAKTKRGQRAMNSKRMVRYKEKRLKAMQPDVDRRLREEEDHEKGEQIWFSRYIHNGRLRHWVLIVHNNKYELRRSENVGDETALKFTYHVAPFTIDDEKRKAALAENALPDVDGFYVCLIGWTTKTKEEVDLACKSVSQQFGEYNLLWKNCQHFLRMLADQILVTKAADFPWFYSNTESRYQKTQHLMPPPLEFFLKAQAQITAQMQVQVQNQIQLQIQNQVQSQIQMQMQNQMQMQMQPPMGG